MTERTIDDVNNVGKATVETPQVRNAPSVNEELRKQIIAEEETKLKAEREAAKNAAKVEVPKVNIGAPQHVTNDTVAPVKQVVNEGLTADDMSRINQDMNSLKRELKQEAVENAETRKRVEAEMRAKILQELQEEQAKKTLAEQVSNSNEVIRKLQEQVQVLNERVPNALVGQEVSNKSPFSDEKSLETATEADIKRIDLASKMAFQNERMRL